MAYGTINADVIQSSVSGVSLGAGNATVFKNRIINGDMRIDQRNAGASITPTNAQYSVDRWIAGLSQASKYSVQQNAGAVTPPAGFTNYLGVTSLSSYSVGASDYFRIVQKVEGLNFSDLSWGTADAKTVTLSFWVRSSLTGTFGGALSNSSQAVGYAFSYSIPVANTWTQISITVAGPTTGTWLTTNGIGLWVIFGLGAGSTYSVTAGSWITQNYINSATGAVSVVGTNGATFYITGVQLEVGSSATGFEYNDYGRQLIQCQRYFVGNAGWGTGFAYSATSGLATINYPVRMRANPTIGYLSGTTISIDFIGGATNAAVSIAASGNYVNISGVSLETTGLSSRTTWQGLLFNCGNLTLSAEL